MRRFAVVAIGVLALVVAVSEVVVPSAAARTDQEPPPATAPIALPAGPGSQPDGLAAVADLGAAAYGQLVAEQLAGWQARRDAAGAELAGLGWTPGTCEPVLEGVPLLGAVPPCDPIVPSVGHWLAINRCEQGGDWHAYGRFGNGLMGGGGLGISDGAWRDWGGGQFAANAAGASPYAQMVVASRGYQRYGGGPWECKA